MKWQETALAGVFVADAEPVSDDRGAFWRSWCEEEGRERGLAGCFAQISMSENTARGTIRGLHLQRPPAPENKFIRVVAGAIWDVIVDLRAKSPTYGRWISVELSSENRRAVYVPEGCAHGFQTLSDRSNVLYHITGAYDPALQDGIRFDDEDLAIAWPLGPPTRISARDRALQALKRFVAVEVDRGAMAG
jgi:dTDP-4-dehydrorhamnose 3,5-epimerase